MAKLSIKKPKILYFVKGIHTTDEQQLAAFQMSGDVCFRNATQVSNTGSIEKCDGVCGEVPERYKHLPSEKEAIANYINYLKEKINSSKQEKVVPIAPVIAPVAPLPWSDKK